MKRSLSYRLLCTLVPACMALVACGGGGSGSDGPAAGAYVAARSDSFSPTTAKDKATNAQNVALHWVYMANNGQPITANMLGVSIGVTVDAVNVTLDPDNLRRLVTMQGPVSATANNTLYSGTYSAALGEDLLPSAGKTVFKNQSTEVNLSLSGGGDSATAKLTANLGTFTPAYEWLLDRETLDQLPINHVETVTTSGTADISIAVSGETPIVYPNQLVSVSERWTVLEKLPSMAVRGTSYNNVVRLSRETKVPDFSGHLTPVTIYYWVAKGIGMIKAQGIYRILNIDDVVYELTETNLTQQ